MKRNVVWLQAIVVLLLTLSLGTGVEGQGGQAGQVVHVVQPGDSLAAIALRYGVALEAIVQENGIQDRNLIKVGQELVIPDPARDPASTGAQSLSTQSPVSPVLEWLPDSDPGPPFTVEISTNRAIPDPLLPASQTYQVAGIVRNDGNEIYAVSRINVTFSTRTGSVGTWPAAAIWVNGTARPKPSWPVYSWLQEKNVRSSPRSQRKTWPRS